MRGKTVRGLITEPGPPGTWRAVALAMAAAFLTLSAIATIMLGPLYDGRLERDAARTPAFSADGEAGVAVWHWRTENLNLEYADVVVVGVRDPKAPPPPGLSRWPKAQEVWASPALIAADRDGSFVGRYGTLAGHIDPRALADPGERFAYVGAQADSMDPERSYEISGFGVAINGTDTGYAGSALYQVDRQGFLVGITLFAIIPALMLSIAAVRIDLDRQRTRVMSLRTIGASPRLVQRNVRDQVLPPVAAGAAAAATIAAAASLVTWKVPGLRFYLVGSDLRPVVWQYVAAAAAVVLWFLTVAALTFRARRERVVGARPVATPLRVRRWPVLVLVAILVTTNYVFTLLYPIDPFQATVAALVGAAASMPFVPALVSACLGWFAALARRWAARSGDPASLIVGRELEAAPAGSVRAITGIALVSIIALQVAVWTSYPDAHLRDAMRAFSANHDKTMSVTSVPSPDQLEAVAAAIPDGTALIGLDDSNDRVWGTCADLENVFGSCATQARIAVSEVGYWIPRDAHLIDVGTTAELAGKATSLVLIAQDGGHLDVNAIAYAFNTVVHPPPGLERPGEPFVVASVTAVDQARWFTAGGTVSVALLSLLCAIQLGFELIRLGRRLAPLGVFAGRRWFHLRLAAASISAPLLLAAAAGTVVGLALVAAPTAPGMPGAFPAAAAAAVILGVIAASTALAALAGATLTRQANAWTPGKDPGE